jgi:hypothetical protein
MSINDLIFNENAIWVWIGNTDFHKFDKSKRPLVNQRDLLGINDHMNFCTHGRHGTRRSPRKKVKCG